MVKTLPDWWFAKYRPIQTISPYQDRLWGWAEFTVPAQSAVTVLYWNAEEVPEGQPGMAAGRKDWIWLITDSVVTADENSLILVRHGVFRYIDGELWITGEVREFGYGRIEGKLGSGLYVWYDEETPYGWYVIVYNYNTIDITCEHYLNGIAEYRGIEKRSPKVKVMKLDVVNPVKYVENAKITKMLIGIGTQIKAYGVNE